MKMMILILLLFHLCLSIKKQDCNKWYALYGCEDKMVLMKNIYRSDLSSFISTQFLSQNPQKKITTLIDFGIPIYKKIQLMEYIYNLTNGKDEFIQNSVFNYFSRHLNNQFL